MEERAANIDDSHQRREEIWAVNTKGDLAFQSGAYDVAARHFEEAVALLTPAEDDIAAPIYENLGLAYFFARRVSPATRAFTRALDGVWTSREQSLRFLVSCRIGRSQLYEAQRLLDLYEKEFGDHPAGWTTEGLREQISEWRRQNARFIPC